MLRQPARPTTVRKRLAIYAASCAGCAGLIASVRLAMPSSDRWLTFEYGPVQLFQGGVLVAALVVIIRRLARVGFRESDSAATAALAFLLFFLAWREIEIDNLLWRTHAFSWKYLIDPDVPPAVKLGLGVPSIGLALALVIYLIPRAVPAVRLTLTRWRVPSLWLLLAGVGSMGVAQLWDKATSIAYRSGVTLFLSNARDPLPEEMLELMGELMMLFCVIEFGRECAARRASEAAAQITLRGDRELPGPQRPQRVSRRPAGLSVPSTERRPQTSDAPSPR